MNVLFITLDQFRGDCLSSAGHPMVRTPNLDELAAHGVRLARHYSQAAPCSPGRACLYTGTYQMNNRVVANGTPLDERFDNIAHAARRAGFTPTLFGYTDQGVDPRVVSDPDDPRLSTYEGVLPGFDVGLEFRRGTSRGCRGWRARGTTPGDDGERRWRRSPIDRQSTAFGVPHRPAARVARAPGRSLVRARELPQAASALRGRRPVVEERTTLPTSPSHCRSPMIRIRSTSASSKRRGPPHRPTRRGCGGCGRSTSAW